MAKNNRTPIGILVLSALCAGLAAVPLAASAKTIHKTVSTHVALSATRTADGTITATASFTSPNRRCLTAKRFQGKGPRAGGVGGFVLYGGPTAGGPYGYDGIETSDLTPDPAPISPAGHSPYVWQAVWPGSTPVRVENGGNPNLPHFYDSTVAAASALALSGVAPGSGAHPPATSPVWFYKVNYNDGGNRVKLKCRSTHPIQYFGF